MKTCRRKTKDEGYTYADWQAEDEKDFHIRTPRDERLIDFAAGLDDNRDLARDMYNLGDADDLPDSDRVQNCRSSGIAQSDCFNG